MHYGKCGSGVELSVTQVTLEHLAIPNQELLETKYGITAHECKKPTSFFVLVP